MKLGKVYECYFRSEDVETFREIMDGQCPFLRYIFISVQSGWIFNTLLDSNMAAVSSLNSSLN